MHARHVAFAAQVGELNGTVFALDNVRREVSLFLRYSKHRTGFPLIQMRQGNGLYHVDSSFNPRRAGS